MLVGRDGRLCAHRVVSQRQEIRGNPHWITQGDAHARARSAGESRMSCWAASLTVIRAGKLIAVPAELSVVEQSDRQRLSGAPFLRRAPSSICTA